MGTLANPSIFILIYNPFQNFSRVHCTQVSDSGPLGLLFNFTSKLKKKHASCQISSQREQIEGNKMGPHHTKNFQITLLTFTMQSPPNGFQHDVIACARICQNDLFQKIKALLWREKLTPLLISDAFRSVRCIRFVVVTL